MARWQRTARECWSPLSTEAEKPPAGVDSFAPYLLGRFVLCPQEAVGIPGRCESGNSQSDDSEFPVSLATKRNSKRSKTIA